MLPWHRQAGAAVMVDCAQLFTLAGCRDCVCHGKALGEPWMSDRSFSASEFHTQDVWGEAGPVSPVWLFDCRVLHFSHLCTVFMY